MTGGKARLFKLAGGAVAAILAAGFLAYEVRFSPNQTSVTRLDTDKILVLRTPGGMLEVSTLVKNEKFGWETKHSCPLINCGSLLGATVTEIRVPVHYRYRIPLAPNWTLTPKGNYYELIVPKEEPALPPAVDFSKMEMRTQKGWLSPSTQKNREALLRQLGPELARRATQGHYIDAQREQASKTVVEFAGKWMNEQGAEKSHKSLPIKVTFIQAASTAP